MTLRGQDTNAAGLVCATMFALVLSACATTTPMVSPAPEPAPQQAAPASKAAIKLYETRCMFKCASYEIEVLADGSYTLNGMSDAITSGVVRGKFAPDVFAKAEAAFDAVKFDILPDRVDRSTMTSGIYCMNDLPDIHFTRRAADGAEKKVIWMTGCPVPGMRAFTDKLRDLFDYDTLVKAPS